MNWERELSAEEREESRAEEAESAKIQEEGEKQWLGAREGGW